MPNELFASNRRRFLFTKDNNVNLKLANGSRATWNLSKPRQELESKCFTREYSDWLLYCAHVMNQSLLLIGRKAKFITSAMLVNAHNHNQNNPNASTNSSSTKYAQRHQPRQIF